MHAVKDSAGKRPEGARDVLHPFIIGPRDSEIPRVLSWGSKFSAEDVPNAIVEHDTNYDRNNLRL